MISESETGSNIDIADDAYAEIDQFESRQKRNKESLMRSNGGPAKPQMRLTAKDGRALQNYLQRV
jgi:hypothetical protein